MNQVQLVTKNQRALLVISNVVTYGRGDLRWLYQFIERSGVALAKTILSPRYKIHRELIGEQATARAFVDTLATFAQDASIKAIDVIMNLHGDEKLLCFAEGAMSTNKLKDELLDLNVRNKLRMLYSTCCYGKSHADDFVAGGFKAASGALATNANAATEYPIVLTLWATGKQLKDAIAAGNNSLLRIPQDRAAKAMGFEDVDSNKVIIGDGHITIRSGV